MCYTICRIKEKHMEYIKELYKNKPVLVKKILTKIFNIKDNQDIVEIKLSEGPDINCDIMLYITNPNGNGIRLGLEDFGIWYNKQRLDFEDNRLLAYLLVMAMVYENQYLQGFHNYQRDQARKNNCRFNAETYLIEQKLAEAITKHQENCSNKSR